MIALSARQSRLARHLLTSHSHFRASIPLRRTFSASIVQRNHETSVRDETEKSIENSRDDHDNTVKKTEQREQHKTPDISKVLDINISKAIKDKTKSRLSALKKGSAKTGKDDKESSKWGKRIFGQSVDKPIRARFAPSPTGYLHLGSLRTALFNNLLAKATKGGEFIIRIEDTDQNRLVPDAEQRVFDDLKWAGLEWSEGPDKGGPYGPYRQSERLPIYRKYAKTLLENGSAYRCFCSHSTLEANAKAQHDAGQPTVYPGTCRTISAEESDERAHAGEPYIVRLDSQKFGRPSFQDAIYGPFQKKQVEEDFVLMKTDGYPTYHLANVVDDHLMKITHVVRGEEWLISTPKHIALYQAFGWEPPTFAHLALLIDNDGSKLSKRNASVNLSTYQEKGIFPLALQAWLANLGSSFQSKAPTPRTIEEVADALTFKFTRGGIKLNPEKLAHFQSLYRQKLFGTHGKDRTKLENEHITNLLVLPIISEVESSTTKPTSPIRPTKATLSWEAPLSPVPAMESDRNIRQKYVFSVLSHDSSSFTDPRELVWTLPYFFWRPPMDVYRHNLATHQIDRSMFDAIEKALSCPPEHWKDAQTGLKMTVHNHSPAEVHNLIRLILVGDPNANSRNTGIMFNILGQDECRHRVSMVRDLLDELDKGGEELRQKWLDERKAEASSA